MADDTLDQIREKFSHDRFATDACGCRVDEARAGHAVCSLDITPKHINEKGVPMGGAIFTLADFAIAVASNLGRVPTFSVSCNIEFLNVARGKRLIATADADRSGHTLGFYTAVVVDELGTPVARMTSVVYGR